MLKREGEREGGQREESESGNMGERKALEKINYYKCWEGK